jgi:hypothetical protein
MAVPSMMPPTMPAPWAVPAPPIMAPPTPIRVGIRAVPSPRPPVAAPRTANEHGFFHVSSGALGEPELARRRDRHGHGVLHRCRKSERGRDQASRKDRISHAFPPWIRDKSMRASGYAPILTRECRESTPLPEGTARKSFFDHAAGVHPLFSEVNRASAGAR